MKMMSRLRPTICPIHNEELVATHPADPENGPEPGDTENRLVCESCFYEEYNSPCPQHPEERIGDCQACFYAEIEARRENGVQS